MKSMTRLVALLLAVLMCAGIVACGKSEEENASTTAQNNDVTTEATQVTEEADDAIIAPTLDLPEELNYNGDVVSVLHWDSEKPEFDIEEITGSLVDDAIYQRNTNIEERLGVELQFTEQNGSVDYMAEFAQAVQNAFQSGGREYDIIPTYSRTAAILSTRGLYYNMNDIEDNYINLEQPWWPDCITDTVTIGDAIYFITGDCSTNVLHMMYTMWFNKDLISEYNLEYPVDLVRENKWTLEKLFSMTADTFQDLNNNGQEDASDFFGFVGVNYGLDAFYTGSGLRLVELAGDDFLMISPDYSSEKAINLVDILGQRCIGTDWFIGSDMGLIFQDDRALFCQNRTYYAENYLLEVEFSYGLVPTPKYDETQEEYISVLANPITLYGIMADVETNRLSEMTAVIECWGYEGYMLTTPALFETNMKLKYSETSDESEMFDIVHSTINLDLGRVFSQDLQFMSEIPSKAAESGAAWASRLAQYKKPLENGLKKIITAFEKIQG
jgi:ABC-type glycerol-3-phosphate transport system substrate-binding protein